jgi:protein O-mannosyl-transferase
MRRPVTIVKPAPRKAANPVRRRPQVPVWLIAALLVLVTIALYWPATSYEFVNYDDDMYVMNNPHVTSGLSLKNASWALGSGYAANWHPVTWLSHMLDCQMFSLKPSGHHLTSVLLHGLNAGLVFALLQLMTGATWRSLWVAALFALHPLRVESVAWVSERKDVLSSCFGLLALIAYVRYAQGRRQNAEAKMQKPAASHTQPSHVSRLTFHSSTFYLLSLLLFALGLMSKPMLVTWPFVMLLLDYWPLGRMQNAECRMQNADADDSQDATRDTRHATRNTHHVSRFRLVLEKLPFLLLAVVGSVVTFVVQQRAGAMSGAEHLPLATRSANALISYGRYLKKLFWPTDLALFYPHPGQWPLAKVLLAVAVILGMLVLVWVQRRQHPYLLVGCLLFFGTLVPVIGLVQVGEQAMADRYTYFPSLGVLVLAVWGAYGLAGHRPYQVLALWVTGGAAIVLCLALTRQQLGYWQDSETLFRHVIKVTENNQVAHKVLGAALDAKGLTDEAIIQYREAIRLKPAYTDAHCDLGTALDKKGQTDEALSQFQEALRLRPDYAEAHYNLGNVLGRKGQMDDAISQFQEAIRLKPGYAEAHFNLGIALDKTGHLDEAISQFQASLRLKPDYAEAHFNLGVALDRKNQPDGAITQFQETIRLRPDHVDARNNLGVVLAKQGHLDEAISQFREALRVKPDHADSLRNLGTALGKKGLSGDATRQSQEALIPKSDPAEARNNLDAAPAGQNYLSHQPGTSTSR